jgi:hypothetical protein
MDKPEVAGARIVEDNRRYVRREVAVERSIRLYYRHVGEEFGTYGDFQGAIQSKNNRHDTLDEFHEVVTLGLAEAQSE